MSYSDKFGDSKNVRHIGHIDVPGGGQVVVQGNYAFIGHMASPDGTTILNVSDPTKPRVVSQLKIPKGTHSHKVRVAGDIMLVNYEKQGTAGEPFEGGLKVFNISNPHKPREISFTRSVEAGFTALISMAGVPTFHREWMVISAI